LEIEEDITFDIIISLHLSKGHFFSFLICQIIRKGNKEEPLKGGTKHWFPLPADFFYHLINELAEVNTVWFLVFWIPLVRLVPTFWILLSQLSGTSQESKKTIPFPTPGLIGIFLVFAWQNWKRKNPAGGPTHS